MITDQVGALVAGAHALEDSAIECSDRHDWRMAVVMYNQASQLWAAAAAATADPEYRRLLANDARDCAQSAEEYYRAAYL